VVRAGLATDEQFLGAVAALKPSVRAFQDQVEREGRIPPALVESLRQAGLYRMVVPRSLGGLEVALPTFFRAVELLSEGDASVGWNVANNATNQLMALSLADEAVAEMFGDSASPPDPIMAGTAVAGGGQATRVEGGYIVSGRWSFGSGCLESDWMVANFVTVHDGQPELNDDGTPILRRVFFPAADTRVIETWDMTGMRGTGSHDWSVEQVFVPARRTVRVPGALFVNQWQRWPGPLYAAPIHAWVGPHHSVVATGIARAGIDALLELAGAKVPRGRTTLLREQTLVQDALARADAVLSAGQAFRERVIGHVWRRVLDGQPTSVQDHARCKLAATYAVDCARQAMDLVYRAGGTTSSRRSHPLARCWRDLHVVAQAASIAPEWYALAGQAMLDLDPGPRLA
jgi:alkylation response protein AidB-like acyl-CoA dehydrogenase